MQIKRHCNSCPRKVLTNSNYRPQYSETNRPNVDMKETPTYITKLVLNANKRDRSPLGGTFQNEYFMMGLLTARGEDLPPRPRSNSTKLGWWIMYTVVEVERNWS